MPQPAASWKLTPLVSRSIPNRSRWGSAEQSRSTQALHVGAILESACSTAGRRPTILPPASSIRSHAQASFRRGSLVAAKSATAAPRHGDCARFTGRSFQAVFPKMVIDQHTRPTNLTTVVSLRKEQRGLRSPFIRASALPSVLVSVCSTDGRAGARIDLRRLGARRKVGPHASHFFRWSAWMN
jgi:hypothetical protein